MGYLHWPPLPTGHYRQPVWVLCKMGFAVYNIIFVIFQPTWQRLRYRNTEAQAGMTTL